MARRVLPEDLLVPLKLRAVCGFAISLPWGVCALVRLLVNLCAGGGGHTRGRCAGGSSWLPVLLQVGHELGGPASDERPEPPRDGGKKGRKCPNNLTFRCFFRDAFRFRFCWGGPHHSTWRQERSGLEFRIWRAVLVGLPVPDGSATSDLARGL